MLRRPGMNDTAQIPKSFLLLFFKKEDFLPFPPPWCPRRDSNPRPQDSSHFGLRRRGQSRVRGLDCPFILGPGRHPNTLRRRPSSLYTFPRHRRGLGSGSARQQVPPAFPDFERIRRAVSHRGAQFLELGILCSILLSYADNRARAPYTSLARCSTRERHDKFIHDNPASAPVHAR